MVNTNTMPFESILLCHDIPQDHPHNNHLGPNAPLAVVKSVAWSKELDVSQSATSRPCVQGDPGDDDDVAKLAPALLP